jgi:hypothetical protein
MPRCAVAFRIRFQNGMGAVAGVNQTRPHCVNQLGKTKSTLSGTAWHGHGIPAPEFLLLF